MNSGSVGLFEGGLGWRQRLQRQRVHALVHFRFERAHHGALTLDARDALERRRHQAHAKMRLAAWAGAGMALMLTRLIDDFNRLRGESARQFLQNPPGKDHLPVSGAFPRLVKIVSTGAPHHTQPMSDYAYKPRLGYDIRVRKAERGETRARTGQGERVCDVPGCAERASVRLAKSPREPAAKMWMCASHAQEHNRKWNFFDGLSAGEAEAIKRASQYGDRPTWGMGKNARARAGAKTQGPADLIDAFGFFTDPKRRADPTHGRMREGRVLTKLQTQAFETLGIDSNTKGPDIKRRYAELVRRFHPDANGGDRSAETQLTAVVRAHQILKKSGIC